MKFSFNSMELEVPEGVYYPAEDSFLLADAVEALEMKGKNILDMGCGSGFLSLLCASKGAHVTAADVTEDAVEATKANAQANGLKVNAVVSDLLQNVSGRFDFIIFNPPYLPRGEDEEGHVTYTGGATGREVIERFITQCGTHLENGGKILLLVSSLTGKEEVIAALNESGFSAKIAAKEKIDWEELVVVEACKSS
ncbi:MAG: methyltransferase [Candidatus Aenigmarchaeota archaeon]|nr:methyltransferase [Candidatus Aenigmarchaeota archaeon]